MLYYIKISLIDFFLVLSLSFLSSLICNIYIYKENIHSLQDLLFSFVVPLFPYLLIIVIYIIIFLWLLNILFFIRKIKNNMSVILFLQFIIVSSFFIYAMPDIMFSLYCIIVFLVFIIIKSYIIKSLIVRL